MNKECYEGCNNLISDYDYGLEIVMKNNYLKCWHEWTNDKWAYQMWTNVY